MKIRSGFVSNSSSASFVVALDALTLTQIDQLVSLNGFCSWRITLSQQSKCIRGDVLMDNDDLWDELKGLGFNLEVFEIRSY